MVNAVAVKDHNGANLNNKKYKQAGVAEIPQHEILERLRDVRSMQY